MTLSTSPQAIAAHSPIAQVIPGRLFFTSYTGSIPKNDSKTLYLDIDEQVHYDAFYDDFGPLNLSVLYRFCNFLNTLLEAQRPNRRIFLYTSMSSHSRVNAVFLIASYMIICQNLTAEQAYLRLQSAEPPNFVGFRDAAMGPPSYLLHVQHVIQSIEKAVKFKWLDFDDFDPDEYEFFERVENGDLNWIIPGKVLSFCGPHERSYIENGYPYHSPDVYFDYFRTHNVTSIIRLNKKIYEAKRFTEAGFDHHDLFFIDGSTPSDDIVLRFIDVVDSAKGAVAIHCKAGLGRTGTLIACWMMKHFRLTAPQCMGWLRVCRPGSVIGPQQHFLIEKQHWCWRLGREEKLSLGKGEAAAEPADEPIVVDDQPAAATNEESSKTAKQQNGTASAATTNSLNNNAATMWSAREAMEAETAVNESGKSQGDRLCQIKANRQQRLQNRLRSSETLGAANAILGSPPAFVLPRESAATTTSATGTTQFGAGSSRTTTGTSTTTAAGMGVKGSGSGSSKFSSSKQHQQNAKDKQPAAPLSHHQYSSATTPIKQLKLSTTKAAGAGTTTASTMATNRIGLGRSPPGTSSSAFATTALAAANIGGARSLRSSAAGIGSGVGVGTTTTGPMAALVAEQQEKSSTTSAMNGVGGGREERRRVSGGGRSAGTAAGLKLPIQKVSVSASSANNNYHPTTLLPSSPNGNNSAAASVLRNGVGASAALHHHNAVASNNNNNNHHRKHHFAWAATSAGATGEGGNNSSRPIRVSTFSSTSRLLKPYQLVGGGGAGSHGHPHHSLLTNERTAAAVNSAKSAGGMAPTSATSSFGRALNRQYARINTTSPRGGSFGLQQSSSSGQIAAQVSGSRETSGVNSALQPLDLHHHLGHQTHNHHQQQLPSPPQFHSPLDCQPLTHLQTNCKYELRPRNLLHMPSRFATGAEGGAAATSAGGRTSPSPFALSRNQKGSRSSTAMFSSRL